MPGGVGGGERPHYLPVREGGGPHSFFAFGLGLAFRVGQFSFFTLAHFSFIIDMALEPAPVDAYRPAQEQFDSSPNPTPPASSRRDCRSPSAAMRNICESQRKPTYRPYSVTTSFYLYTKVAFYHLPQTSPNRLAFPRILHDHK